MARNSKVALLFDSVFPNTELLPNPAIASVFVEALLRITRVSDIAIHSCTVDRFTMIRECKRQLNSICKEEWTDKASEVWNSLSFYEEYPKGVLVDLDAKAILRVCPDAS